MQCSAQDVLDFIIFPWKATDACMAGNANSLVLSILLQDDLDFSGRFAAAGT
jgi:hypothetical protein